jgi:hypothetical protein
MIDDNLMTAERITDASGRMAALEVLSATYQKEKGWINDPERQFPVTDVEQQEIAWFIVRFDGQPAGVLRTLYDPPLLQYSKYGLKLLDGRIDVESFLRQPRIAEVGRFAVVAEHRGNLLLAAALMRVATEDMVARGYTHVITDVFEDDVHSPLGFHTRVASPPDGGRRAITCLSPFPTLQWGGGGSAASHPQISLAHGGVVEQGGGVAGHADAAEV